MRKSTETPNETEDNRHLDMALACPVCKSRRVKIPTGWVCSVGFSHTGIMGRVQLAEKLDEKLRRLNGEDHPSRAKRIAAIVKQAEREGVRTSTN
jgi:hypothetical protein